MNFAACSMASSLASSSLTVTAMARSSSAFCLSGAILETTAITAFSSEVREDCSRNPVERWRLRPGRRAFRVRRRSVSRLHFADLRGRFRFCHGDRCGGFFSAAENESENKCEPEPEKNPPHPVPVAKNGIAREDRRMEMKAHSAAGPKKLVFQVEDATSRRAPAR